MPWLLHAQKCGGVKPVKSIPAEQAYKEYITVGVWVPVYIATLQ
jgi:hypothetical protein